MKLLRARYLQDVLFFFLCVLVAADLPAYYNSTDYDLGKLGIFVERSFNSTSLKAPQINFLKWGPECETDEYFFIAPRGLFVGPVGPVIFDSKGHLVWHREDFGVAYGLTVQQYRGEPVLTFWSGDDMVTGHGQGYYYILDSSYRQLHKVAAVGPDLYGDLHEFKITPDNTALLTIYNKTRGDLSHYGSAYPTAGWIWDCLFQEVDIATNALLFQWRASDHFGLRDCFHPPGITGRSPADPFDWFHLNSVDKDSAGNFLVSARYSHAATYLSGRTGAPLWHLGGRRSSFADLSAGRATAFAWQHDARLHDLPGSGGGRAVSLFDNAAYFGNASATARGLLVAIDTAARPMTARLVTEWSHPDPARYIAESQGSLQLLPAGGALVGYGAVPVLAQFAPDGALQCEAAFGALHWREGGAFGPGAVMSYRAARHAWVGSPVEPPRVAFTGGQFFVSWNGDTRARAWRLEGRAGVHAGGWVVLCDLQRQGFESACDVETGMRDRRAHWVYRLTARGGGGEVLGVWSVDAAGVVVPAGWDAAALAGGRAARVLAVGALGLLVGMLVLRRRWWCWSRRVRGVGDAEGKAVRQKRVHWEDDGVAAEREGLVRAM